MLDQASELRNIIKSKGQSLEQDLNSNRKKSNSTVVSVSSGKGGVGKSNLVANLAIFFAKYNKKVLIIDADLGLANIEVLFGIIPKKNLMHILNNEATIDEALSQGPMDIKLLSGGSGLRALPELTTEQQIRLINNFKYLDKRFDIILIDNGAGVNSTVINFIKASDEILIVSTPEPTSITDAYALIKIVTEDMNKELKLNLIINQANDLEESKEVFQKLQLVSSKFLGVDLNYLGYLPVDNKLSVAVRMQNPIALSYPDSKYCKMLDLLCQTIINNETFQLEEESFAKKLIGFFKKV